MDKQTLIDFEERVADAFNNGEIRYPVHLEAGNEGQLIRIFNEHDIRPQDWVFVSWRGHLKALLKGVSEQDLMDAIQRGESMALRFPFERVYGSAIVGGIIPIALGAAMAIQRRGLDERVYCFVGDMTAMTGIFHECRKYAEGFDLPINFIIEDNGKSVCTDTGPTWNIPLPESPLIHRFTYQSKWPHAGAGKRVEF